MTPAIRQLLFDRPLIKKADGYWDAEFYDSTVDALVDRNMRGIGNARLGSAVGPDTNDPTRPVYSGEKYLLLPGTAGNYASTPDSASNSISGDIDIRILVSAESYASGTAQRIVSKSTATGNQRSWFFSIEAAGELRLVISEDGAITTGASSTVAVGFSSYAVKWLRVTWRASDGETLFYTSDDGSSWSQLGTAVTILKASIFNSTAIVELGSLNAGTLASGVCKIFNFELRNGISGTVVNKFRASQFTSESTTAVADTGETWTINSASAAGAKAQIIDRTCILGNLSDYCIVTSGVPTIGTGDFTIAGVMLVPFANPASNTGACWYLGPSNAANAGINAFYAYIDTSGQLLVIKHDGAGASQTVATIAGFRAAYSGKWVALTASRAGGTWIVSANGNLLVTNSTFGSEAVGSANLGIGTNAAAYSDYPITKTAFFTRALTLSEHRRLAIEMGASI